MKEVKFKRKTRKQIEKLTLEDMRTNTIMTILKNEVLTEALKKQVAVDSGDKSGKSSTARTNSAIELKNMREQIKHLEAQGMGLESDLKLVEKRLKTM